MRTGLVHNNQSQMHAESHVHFVFEGIYNGTMVDYMVEIGYIGI